MTVTRFLRAFHRDGRGAVAPMVAVLGTALMGSSALALDVGLYYVDSRALQAATEAAALAAAVSPANATARAQAYLSKNNFDPSVLRSVTVGCYDADGRAGVAISTRFTACSGGRSSTAVRITTSKVSRQFMSRALGSANPIPVATATATAARVDEAGIGITTGILSVNAGMVTSVNNLLGALLGINLNLSGPQIGTLMGSNIDAGRFFDALASRVGETGTYSDLTSRTVPLADILAAGATAAAADGNTASASVLSAIAAQAGTGYNVPLTGLFGLGVWSKMPVGESTAQPGLRAGLNAYQLLAFAIQDSGGKIDASDLVSLAVPGSTVRLAAVATGPIDRPRFAFGPEGDTKVGTSALRIQLQLALPNVSLGLLGVSLASVESVPVLIDIAAGTAELTSISCSEEAEIDTVAEVQVSSGLVNAYVGNAPAGAMSSPMPTITASDITAARIVNVLGLITVDARAVAQPVAGTSRLIAFGPGRDGTIGRPPAPGTAASIGNSSQVGPLLTSLSSSIGAPGGLDVKALGLCLPLICGSSVRSQLLTGITTPLSGLVGTVVDPLLDNVLAALGIQLGSATIWVTGARCGVPVLI